MTDLLQVEFRSLIPSLKGLLESLGELYMTEFYYFTFLTKF